jgi:hypothetical protein
MDNDKLMQLLAAMNPELAPILALLMDDQVVQEKPKRKPSAYNRRYAAAYRRIKKKNTLKSGKMKKGYAKRDGSLSKAGHAKIRTAAHKEAKK